MPLLFHGRPPHVAGFISTVVVAPINRMLRTRFRTKFFFECNKRISETFRHFYSSTAIIFERRVARTTTAPLGSRPNFIERRFIFAVFLRSLYERRSSNAAATGRRAIFQRESENNFRGAARTPAKPHSIAPVFSIGRSTHDGPSSEDQTGQVFDVRIHPAIICNFLAVKAEAS